MKFFVSLLLSLSICLMFTLTFADDGTINAPIQSDNMVQKAGSFTNPSDEVYVITPFESVSISSSSTWQDNRHRAYWSTSITDLYGCLLFDVTQIPDTEIIISMTLKCYLEVGFGSPSANPVVDIYWCPNDNWTRNSATPGSIQLVDLVVNNVPFTTYVPDYTFTINVGAHDWIVDLSDNRITLGFKNDVNYYSYVYFFGAYGTPTGPPPELTITTAPGTPLDVNVELTPVGLPIQIPAGGGTFQFNIEVTNNEPTSSTFTVWTMATLPNGSEYGPIINTAATLPGNASGDRDRTQVVPASAPAGMYTYDAYVGIYPNNIWDEDHFQFEKLAADDGSGNYPGWTTEGEDFFGKPEVVNLSTPGEFAMVTASPNPFNPTTDITFSLNEAGNISLVIYDVSGREISRLAEGYYDSGSYKIGFNAEGKSSGIYFAVLKTSYGAKTAKLLLVK